MKKSVMFLSVIMAVFSLSVYGRGMSGGSHSSSHVSSTPHVSSSPKISSVPHVSTTPSVGSMPKATATPSASMAPKSATTSASMASSSPKPSTMTVSHYGSSPVKTVIKPIAPSIPQVRIQPPVRTVETHHYYHPYYGQGGYYHPYHSYGYGYPSYSSGSDILFYYLMFHNNNQGYSQTVQTSITQNQSDYQIYPEKSIWQQEQDRKNKTLCWIGGGIAVIALIGLACFFLL